MMLDSYQPLPEYKPAYLIVGLKWDGYRSLPKTYKHGESLCYSNESLIDEMKHYKEGEFSVYEIPSSKINPLKLKEIEVEIERKKGVKFICEKAMEFDGVRCKELCETCSKLKVNALP